jgi:hypothetical protein
LTSASIPLLVRRSFAHAGGRPGPRVRERTISTSPIAPSSSCCFACTKGGSKRRMKASWRVTPARSVARIISSHSADRERHRLLAQHVQTVAGRLAHQRCVRERRGGDDDGVEAHRGQGGRQVGEGMALEAQLVGRRGGALRVRIDHRDQFRVGNVPPEVPRVHHAGTAGPDRAHPDVSHRVLPSVAATAGLDTHRRGALTCHDKIT